MNPTSEYNLSLRQWLLGFDNFSNRRLLLSSDGILLRRPLCGTKFLTRAQCHQASRVMKFRFFCHFFQHSIFLSTITTSKNWSSFPNLIPSGIFSYLINSTSFYTLSILLPFLLLPTPSSFYTLPIPLFFLLPSIILLFPVLFPTPGPRVNHDAYR